MEPQGRERHRWAKPRGRSGPEHTSQCGQRRSFKRRHADTPKRRNADSGSWELGRRAASIEHRASSIEDRASRIQRYEQQWVVDHLYLIEFQV